MRIPEPYYAAKGTGEVIANYLADRLYQHGIARSALAVLAAFIFRESENATAGVGSGMDMQFIFDGDRSIRAVGWNEIEELKSTIPALDEAVYEYWKTHPTVSERLAKTLDAPRPSAKES